MEATIGFDLRSTVPDPSWTADRRARYLLRRDIASVRSVDPMVWERPPGFPRSPEPVGLWPGLHGLLAAASALDQAGAVIVRITAFEEEGGPPPGADPVAGQFDLVGYDVADYGLISGLTNCGYAPQEAASLASVWAPRLNQWHLFDNPGDAEAYAAVTERRVPEHAPFFGYGIYQLRLPPSPRYRCTARGATQSSSVSTWPGIGRRWLPLGSHGERTLVVGSQVSQPAVGGLRRQLGHHT